MDWQTASNPALWHLSMLQPKRNFTTPKVWRWPPSKSDDWKEKKEQHISRYVRIILQPAFLSSTATRKGERWSFFKDPWGALMAGQWSAGTLKWITFQKQCSFALQTQTWSERFRYTARRRAGWSGVQCRRRGRKRIRKREASTSRTRHKQKGTGWEEEEEEEERDTLISLS